MSMTSDNSALGTHDRHNIPLLPASTHMAICMVERDGLASDLAFHINERSLHIPTNRASRLCKDPIIYVNCLKNSHELPGANGVDDPEFVCDGL
jgi:hypothetical protein